MIAHAAFQPQAAAFTSMLSMCAKNREWQKALEVFQAMRDYHPAVRPNTVHYSSLISACATVGRCEEAMQVGFWVWLQALVLNRPASLCCPRFVLCIRISGRIICMTVAGSCVYHRAKSLQHSMQPRILDSSTI